MKYGSSTILHWIFVLQLVLIAASLLLRCWLRSYFSATVWNDRSSAKGASFFARCRLQWFQTNAR
ncbi:hypothetical protein [Rhodopirellula baltica]|uniref:hypothetical protein n=1 Tax=Rhodopirellula baltica TaxID=265606 RepID=UPI001F15CD40|nr:hypothetical protein [Rhodopirellula baltica]